MNEQGELQWLSAINLQDLQVEAPFVFFMDHGPKSSIDDVAAMMVHGGPKYLMAAAKRPGESVPNVDTRPDKSYWVSFKKEFYLFLCKRDRKYAELHKELDASGNKSSTVVLTLISAAMSPHIGISAGVVVPFCAVCLYALAKLGKESFCRSIDCSE